MRGDAAEHVQPNYCASVEDVEDCRSWCNSSPVCRMYVSATPLMVPYAQSRQLTHEQASGEAGISKVFLCRATSHHDHCRFMLALCHATTSQMSGLVCTRGMTQQHTSWCLSCVFKMLPHVAVFL